MPTETLSFASPDTISTYITGCVMTHSTQQVTVGVLALQGAFSEHIQLLSQAAFYLKENGANDSEWRFIEVRTTEGLGKCDALIIPGGESTTMSLVAARSGMLGPLREYVKSVSPVADVLVSTIKEFIGFFASLHGALVQDSSYSQSLLIEPRKVDKS